MIRLASCVALVSVPLAACLTEGAPPEEVGSDPQEIIGGTATSDYPAVPLLSLGFGGGAGALCSGTLVSPRVILTAAHCVDPSPADITAYFGTTVTGNDPGRIEEIPAQSWEVFHPDWSLEAGDFALVLLERDAQAEPMGYLTDGLGFGDVGRPLHLVGWGNTVGGDPGSGAGSKRHVTASIQEVGDWLVTYGSASANTCQGDSGGPGFLTVGGEEVVATVTSWGVFGCTGESGAGRVDRVAGWIADYIAQNDVPIPPEVSFARPADGERVRPGFAIHVEASDNTRLESLEITANGVPVPGIQLEIPPYVVNAPELPDGPVTLVASATDNRGDTTTATVQVTLDSSCSQPSDCGSGFVCEDGACVPGSGATGDLCTSGDECLSGMCGTVGDESRCTQQCTPGGEAACPSGLECRGDGEVGYCWPSGDEGGCQVADSPARGGLTALLIGLALLLAARCRRFG